MQKMTRLNGKINLNEIKGTFYMVPFLSDFAILSIITGENRWGTYRIAMNSMQMRLYGIFILFLCGYITYNVLIEWPKKNNRPEKVKDVLKIFFTSYFFYLWLLLLIVSFLYEIYGLIIIKISYYIILGACLYFQYKFMKKVEKIL